jgi:hypothetical protein
MERISLTEAGRETTELLQGLGVEGGMERRRVRRWCDRHDVKVETFSTRGWPTLVSADVPALIAAEFAEKIRQAIA